VAALPYVTGGQPTDIGALVMLGWALLCIVSLLYASARVHGKRAAWDRWANTMVRYRR
jgi:hypothetical protein